MAGRAEVGRTAGGRARNTERGAEMKIIIEIERDEVQKIVLDQVIQQLGAMAGPYQKTVSMSYGAATITLEMVPEVEAVPSEATPLSEAAK